VVWIAFLAKADAEGMVRVAPSRMVKIANVPQAKFDKAVEILESPDPESRTSDDDGRRLRKIEGGWLVINYKKYRNELESEERKAYKREWDRKNRPSGHSRAKTAISGENQQSDTQSDNSPTQPDKSDVSISISRGKGISSSSSCLNNANGNGEPKPTTTTTTAILSAWGKLPLPPNKRDVDMASQLAIERVISELALDTKEPIHHGMILEAIGNYEKALKLPDSQAYKENLYNWLTKRVRKYVGYAFDLDNYRSTNFAKQQGKSDLQEEHRKAVERGDL